MTISFVIFDTIVSNTASFRNKVRLSFSQMLPTEILVFVNFIVSFTHAEISWKEGGNEGLTV